jgi:hypothetical protein
MAGRFNNPFPQFFDSSPNVYSGGKLYFYASGTSTPLSTYTTKALAVANTNPVVLNSAGRPSTDIFLQDLEYKVVLKDVNDVVIWTADPVSHRDSALVAKTLTGNGSPNGAVAGTAGSASILPDFYWDYTNSVLYVCTATGTASTAVWTAVNASSATAAVPPPQGRLTPVSGASVISSDATSVTAIYYTPVVGNLVPIYNGASMIPTEFSELTLTLAASHALNTIYDVFVFSNSGVLTLATGPAWNTSTAGSGARGTGASTTQIARVKGLYVNAVSMTGRNGANTYTIGANLATYLGSIFIDGTAGQVTCHTSYGQSRKWGVWNAFNQRQILLKAGDATASWATATATWRQSRADATNFAMAFTGLADGTVTAMFEQYVTLAMGNNTPEANIGIGINSTTVLSGQLGGAMLSDNISGVFFMNANLVAKTDLVPSLGANQFNMIEQAPTVSASSTYNGGSSKMRMDLSYPG